MDAFFDGSWQNALIDASEAAVGPDRYCRPRQILPATLSDGLRTLVS